MKNTFKKLFYLDTLIIYPTNIFSDSEINT